ncbi:MAG: SMC-Scp complex subunit ScpB [Oscillospiraceae bacterium]
MTLEENLKAAEAIIFASGEGISAQSLKEVLDLDLKQLQYIISALEEKYDEETSGIKLIKNTDVLCFATSEDTAESVYRALSVKRSSPLSNAAMETLAIIAYNQPVSRAFIEQVRGVDSTSSVQTLIAKNLIEEAGRLDIPGKPISYKTTSVFLRSFSLEGLGQLPKVKSTVSEGQLSTDDYTAEDRGDEYNS